MSDEENPNIKEKGDTAPPSSGSGLHFELKPGERQVVGKTGYVLQNMGSVTARLRLQTEEAARASKKARFVMRAVAESEVGRTAHRKKVID